MKRLKIFSSIWYALLLLVIAACKKDYKLNLSLAVNATEVDLKAEGGTDHILIYANGSWTVKFKEQDAAWASLDRLQGSGNSEVIINYEPNFGLARTLTLQLFRGDETKEITIVQAGQNAAFRFSKSNYVISATPLQVSLPIVSNLKYNVKDIKIDYKYDSDASQWISNPILTDTAFTFNALQNTTGKSRRVRINLTTTDSQGQTQTVYADVQQTQDQASLKLPGTQVKITRNPTRDTVLLTGNAGLSLPFFTKAITYQTGGSDWIKNVILSNQNMLIFDVNANNSGQDRTANINLKLLANGVTIIDLNQLVLQSTEDYQYKYATYPDVRAMVTGITGQAAIKDPLKAIEGIVISDTGNPNMETNPNLTFNTMDLTETNRTAYVEAVDGSFGFRLKFNTAADNVLKRYSKVSIALNGSTIVKEANPERYTITGLTAASIIKNAAGTATDLAQKNKTISSITDADVYTWVNLQNAEFSEPYGAYANVNAGYTLKTNWNQAGLASPYLDAIPSNVHDDAGGNLNLLVNSSAPWSRNTISKGSGPLSGVIVHSDLVRFGVNGDIGRYAIRPLDENDIKLSNPAKMTKIVEWNWLKNGSDVSAAGVITKDENGNVLPVSGQGTLSCTAVGASPSLGANPVYQSDPTSKAMPNSALQYNATWWNVSNNTGEAFELHFSTSGISGHSLMVNFSQGGGSGSITTLNVPVYWQIEYSTDGQAYTVLPNSTYYVRPLAAYGVNLNDVSLGLASHSFKLPDALFNQPQVYIRLKAQQNICGTNSPDGGEAGTITSSANNAAVAARLGAVTIGYTN